MIICRTCLSAESLSNIFENFNSVQINSAAGVIVQENDGFPQMICKVCKDLLTGALQLRQQSLYAERVLLEELSSTIKLERDGSTGSNNVNTHLRQPMKVKTRRKTEIKVEQNRDISNADNTSSKHIMCKNETAEASNKNNLKSILNQDKTRNFKIDIKIENDTESSDLLDQTVNHDLYDDLLQEVAEAPNPKSSSSLSQKEELQQMYKIIDEELERSKSKYKSKVNVKEVLKEDKILELLSPDLKSLFSENSVGNSREIIPISRLRHKIQVQDKAKLAKLWAFAAKPIVRNKMVQCKVCPKQFKHNYFLRHATTHLEKEFTCEMCGSKFVHVHALRYHQQRKHGAARKHACAHCDYSAVQREELQNHENRVHTGLRPFICDVCGDGFCQRRTLVQHMRRHYGVKRHRCEFCEKLFTSTSQLGAHRKQFHLMRYTFLCYVCPYRSTVRDTVRRHLLRVHGIARPLQQTLKVLKEKR